MPQFLENKLNAEASKKGFTGRRAARYVYGAMNDEGVMHGNKETAKGAAMDAKHKKDQQRARMHSDIQKFKGESAEHSFRRPTRKVIRHHA